MSDAASLITAISSISITVIKLLSTLSQFVDEVSQAPPEVQRLQNQLSTLYASLGETKNDLHRVQKGVLVEGDLDEKIQYTLVDCEEVLGMLEGIVDRAKRKEVKYVGATKWARVKFTFNEAQIQIISDRLAYYCHVLHSVSVAMKQYDPSTRMELLDTPKRESASRHISQMIEILKNNRSKVKMALLALEEDESNIPDIDYQSVGTKSPPSSYHPSAAGPAGSSASSSPRPKSPTEAAMIPYRLTRDELNAQADARSTRWELRHMEFECPISPSRNRYLHYEGKRAGLTVRIDTGPPLTCVVQKVTDDYDIEKYNYLVTWSDISFNPSTYSVSTTSRDLKKLPDGYPGTETFTFDSRRDAMEFYQCLKVLIPLHRRCWERAVVALAPLTNQYRVDEPVELEFSARKLSRSADLRVGADEESEGEGSLRGSLAVRKRGD